MAYGSMNWDGQKAVDSVIQSLILTGLTLEQVHKLPKWLLDNIEKNQSVIAAAIIDARIDERKSTKLPFTGDHKNCIDPRTCIGYQGAESDLYNENLLRIEQLEKQKEKL